MSNTKNTTCSQDCSKTCKNYQPITPQKDNYGWICAKCGRGIAPNQITCPYCGPTYTWISTSPWWSGPYYTTTNVSNTIDKDSITASSSNITLNANAVTPT